MASIFSHCQKGPGERVTITYITCPCSLSCDHLIWVRLSHFMSFSPAQLLPVQQKYLSRHSLRCSPGMCKPCPGWGLSPGKVLPSPASPAASVAFLPPHPALPHQEQSAPGTALLRHGGEQHSPERGCSSWVVCDGYLYISPLWLLFLYFIFALPPQRLLSSSSSPFLSGPWIAGAQPLLQQKGGVLEVFGVQQKENQRLGLFAYYGGI